nr:MAG TPA: GDSL like Lipase Acylhydrolase [Caudoviricetes sp.]
MALIADILNTIKNARKGKDMRQAIYDGIQQCYEDATGHPDSVAAVVEEINIERKRLDNLFANGTAQTQEIGKTIATTSKGGKTKINFSDSKVIYTSAFDTVKISDSSFARTNEGDGSLLQILKEGLYYLNASVEIKSEESTIPATAYMILLEMTDEQYNKIGSPIRRIIDFPPNPTFTIERQQMSYLFKVEKKTNLRFIVSSIADTSDKLAFSIDDIMLTALDWKGKQSADLSELHDLRIGADSTVYETAGEAVRKQIGNLTEDLVNSSRDIWTWNGSFDLATEKFNPTDIVGNNYIFKSGFVDSIELAVSDVSGNDAALFITDTDRKILFKTTKKIEDNDLCIQVNKFFDVDFYVFVSYPGIKYYNSTNVQSDKWAGLSFSRYGNYIIGDVLADFNNNGKIGFSFKVKYYTTTGKIAENTKNIEKYHSTNIKIVSETDKAHFGIDENGILFSRKISNTPGCYPCFFNEIEHLKFKATSDKTWVIVSKDGNGKFVALGMERDGIIFASFNADGSVLSVDYTQNYLVKNWLGSEIALRWVDDYFCSIYRNGNFIYKFDIRHTNTSITDHCFGIGMYSNMENGVRAEIMKYDINDKTYFDDACVLGDSFTDNTRDSLGTGTFYFTRWYEFARETNHIEMVYNYGFGGTCMSPSVSGENSFYNRMQTMYSEHNNPSAVFVLGGTNDYHNDVPLGTINDVTTDTFYGTLNKMCEYFKENFHTSKVVFCTPIMRVSPSNGKTETTPANNQMNSNGNSIEQFANAMIEVCHKWALPCFDAYHNSGICPQARNTQNFAWFMNDGIHMKQNGHKQLGMRFGEFAKQFM